MIDLTKYQQFIRSEVGRKLGFDNPDLDDVVQTINLAMLRTMSSYDPARGKPLTWIGWKIRSGVNGYFEHMNTPTMRMAIKIEDILLNRDSVKKDGDNDQELIEMGVENDLELRLQTADVLKRIADVLDGLPEKVRRAFILRLIEEKSGYEAAEVLNSTRESVEKSLHRIRILLREEIGDPL